MPIAQYAEWNAVVEDRCLNLLDVFLPSPLRALLRSSSLIAGSSYMYALPRNISMIHDHVPRWFSGIIRPSGFLTQESTSLSMGEVPRSIRGWGLFAAAMFNTASSSVSE
jgi:hypothetical protein